MNGIKIGAFGDVMFGVCSSPYLRYDELLPVRLQKDSIDVSAFNHFVRENDINIANLESPISRDIVYRRGEKKLIGPVESINVLENLNINLVSLANNHSFDYGNKILEETKKLLLERGIHSIHSPQHGDMVYHSERKGIRLSIIAYGAKPFYNVETDSIDPDYYKNWSFYRDIIHNMDESSQIDYLSKGNLKPLVLELQKQKNSADFVIIYIHWGFTNTRLPSPLQIEIAHKLIDMGADAVIGHHPHVIQPVEIYKGKPIAYSLGNFLFDSWKSENKRSLVLQINVRDHSIVNHFYISDRDSHYKFRIETATMREKIINYIDQAIHFVYPDFMEWEISNADDIISSYYKYSKYRSKCRSQNLLKTIKELWKSDYRLRSKISIISSYINSF